MNNSLNPTPGQFHGERFGRYARRMRDEIRSLDRSQKQIAMDLQMDQGQLSKILSGEKQLGVHHLEVWDREIGHGLLDYILAQREEGHGHGEPLTISAMLALRSRQHGACMGEILAALDDNTLSAQEARDLLPGLLKEQHLLAEMVRLIEQVSR